MSFDEAKIGENYTPTTLRRLEEAYQFTHEKLLMLVEWAVGGMALERCMMQPELGFQNDNGQITHMPGEDGGWLPEVLRRVVTEAIGKPITQRRKEIAAAKGEAIRAGLESRALMLQNVVILQNAAILQNLAIQQLLFPMDAEPELTEADLDMASLSGDADGLIIELKDHDKEELFCLPLDSPGTPVVDCAPVDSPRTPTVDCALEPNLDAEMTELKDQDDMNSKPVALDPSQYNPPSNAPRDQGISSWTDQEDNLVRQHVATTGPKKWPKCAHMLPGRTPQECSNRWRNYLDPTIKREPWTDAEDEILLQARAKHGNQWALIGKMLGGRTYDDVRNRARRKPTGERSTGSKKRKLQELQSQVGAAQVGQQ